MGSLMLIISFLLHIITLFAVYQLLQQVKSFQKRDDTKNTIAVMEVYLEDIRKENGRLEELVKIKNIEQKVNVSDSKNNNVEFQNINRETSNAEREIDELDPILNQLPGYEVDTSLEAKVLQLYDKGMTIEEIAKKLGCGKTEAELIVKLYQKQ